MMRTFFVLCVAGLLSLYFMGCHNEMGINKNQCHVVEAAYTGDVDLLVHELDRGCNPKGDSNHVNEPVYAGIFLGNIDVVKVLLDAGVDPQFDWGESGGDLLTNAVQFGHERIVELLINHGASVNRANGHSALYRSIIQGNDTIEKYLRANGAVLNSLDKDTLEVLSIPYCCKDNK